MIDLLFLLGAITIGGFAGLGVYEAIKRVQHRVRGYRVGKMLRAVEKGAYQERVHDGKGVSRSVWEGGDDDAA